MQERPSECSKAQHTAACCVSSMVDGVGVRVLEPPVLNPARCWETWFGSPVFLVRAVSGPFLTVCVRVDGRNPVY